MRYPYCTKCKCRVWSDKETAENPYRKNCTNPSSHRANKDIKYRADFTLNGRRGERLRPLFNTAEEADDFERNTKSDFKRGKYFPDMENVTFADLADEYYKVHCLNENAPDKGRSQYYRIQLAKSIFKKKLASEITRDDIRDLRLMLQRENGLTAKPWSGATVNRFIGGVLRPIFNKGIEWNKVRENPCTHLPKVKENDPIPRFLNQQELAALYQSFNNDRLRDYADVLFHSGARPSSIERCSFDNGDVDLTNRVIWFTTYKGRNKKHRYPHPLDDVLYEIVLRRMVATGGKGKVFDTVGMRKLAKAAIERSGINKDRPANQKFTIYGLKHCYASSLLLSGVVMDVAGELLGHTDYKMVKKHYGKFTLEHLRAAQAKAKAMLDKPAQSVLTPKLHG